MGIAIVNTKTLRITGWQWSAAELPVRVNAVVYARHGRELMG
jgi:hypothetical protein